MLMNGCLYCPEENLVPTGAERVTNGQIEHAYTCPSCDHHTDTFYWLPDNEIPQPTIEPIYDDYQPETTEPEYSQYFTSTPPPPEMVGDRSSWVIWAIIGLFVLAFIAGLSIIL